MGSAVKVGNVLKNVCCSELFLLDLLKVGRVQEIAIARLSL
jgi:hypothetical protein